MEMLLTVEQAAERLQLTPYTVRRHLNEGRLRGIKKGHQWRVPESAITEPAGKNGHSQRTARPGLTPDANAARIKRVNELMAQVKELMKDVPARTDGGSAQDVREVREAQTP